MTSRKWGYSMRANCKYLYGESNHQSKLKDSDRDKIITMTEYKDRKISEIDEEIERLKQEKDRLKKQYSHKQLAMDFGVKPITISRTLKGEYR